MTQVNYSKQNTAFCLELDRVKLLLEKAGNPDKKFRIIHVAGTNGKGSVCAFLESGFVSMGEKCGVFTSPELFCVEDSIRVDKVPVESTVLKNILKKLSKHSGAVETELGKAPSPFEVLFVAALLYFKSQKCKTVIIECGLGGLGDATNSIGHSDVCVFTNIGIDHTNYLGNTIKDIATNKCGIIREGTLVISANQVLDAEEVILKTCREKNCQLTFVSPLDIINMDLLNPITDVGFSRVRLSLAGCHQAKNAAVAVSVLLRLGAEEKDIVYALTRTVHRARLEEIFSGVYFDGAHNVDGVKALVESINAAGINDKLNFVVGFMADKDINACFDELNNLKNTDIEFFTTPVHTNPRTETAQNLQSLAEAKGYTATACPDVKNAVKCAMRNGGAIFVFGSLYMYKELRGKIGGGNKRRFSLDSE